MAKISKNGRVYGLKPSLPDHRNHTFSLVNEDISAIPPMVDLRTTGFMPPVWDQGALGACTAHGIGAAWAYERAKQKLPFQMPSRLFIYYNERDMEGSVNSDSGAAIADGLKVVNKFGVPEENIFPYVPEQFTVRPPQQAYDLAIKETAVSYASVPVNLTSIKGVLASGFPVVIGLTLYSSFEENSVAATGLVPMPQHNEEILGGHCLLVAGFSDKGFPGIPNSANHFLVRNSWNTTWGDKGYCYIPYAYFNSQLASDFWCIKMVKA